MAEIKQNSGAAEIKAIQSVMDSMDTCVYVTDMNTGEIIFMNKKMTDVFGGKNLIGKICWKVLQHGFSEECSFCPCKVLRENQGTPIVWEEHNTVTGKYYKNTDTVIKWPDGRTVHIQNSLDITDLKKTQESLSQQVATQELITDIAVDFASVADLNQSMKNAISNLGVFLKADKIALVKYDSATDTAVTAADWASNPRYFSKERVINLNLLDPDRFADKKLRAGKVFILSDPDVPASLRKLLTDRFGVKNLFNIPIFSGKNYWGLMVIQHINETTEWDSASLLLAQAVCSTISSGIERKQTEQILFRTKQELREIVDNVPICIYWKDTSLNFTGCNMQFAKYFNVNPDEILGKTLATPVFRDIYEKMFALEKKTLESRKPCLAHEFECLNPQKLKNWFSASVVPVFDDSGEITSLLGIFRDITSRKRSEIEMIEHDKELKRVLEIAEKSDKAKSEFLSRMSHEIRTPMNAIIGMTKIAAGSDDMPKIKSCLSKVDAASAQLLSIINDILDMSKIEAGKITVAKEQFNLETMLQNVCNIIMIKSDEKRQKLNMHIAGDVPAALIGDEMRLTQVLTNLLSNAVKFTPEGGDIRLTARLLGRKGKTAEIEFMVEDSGIGMSKEHMSRLFMAFEQADGGISRKYGGTGLGLSISKNLVGLMGGSIRAESEQGKGSRFIFTVKMEATGEKQRARLSKGTSAKNLNVLITDDSPETREFFKTLMSNYNIPAQTAVSGEQAVDMVGGALKTDKPYSLIFMDWKMPGIDGIEATRAIKKKYGGQVEVVLISAAEWPEIEKEAVSAGIKHYLHKPLFPSTIINTINEILGAPQKPADASVPMPDFSGNTVLVAEDVEINRDILSAVLEPSKLIIEYAENGKKAVDMFGAAPDKYTLILMDVHMPEMDGYEATRRIRRLPVKQAATAPIIAMTANVFAEDIARCLEAGMNGHLGKPIDDKKLFDVLSKYIKPKETKKMDEAPKAVDYEKYLPFIDIADGLNRIRGNKKLYAMMLKSFKTNPVFPDAKAAVLSGDLKNAQMHMHALKGIAGNLSFKQLYELVVPVEAILKTTLVNPKELIPVEDAFVSTMGLIDSLIAELN